MSPTEHSVIALLRRHPGQRTIDLDVVAMRIVPGTGDPDEATARVRHAIKRLRRVDAIRAIGRGRGMRYYANERDGEKR